MVLRRFLRVRIVAITVVVIAAGIKLSVWEQGVFSSPQQIWIIIRWALITFMAGTALYELFHLEGAIETAYEGLDDPGEESESARRFQHLHSRSESLMKLSLLAGVGAMLLN